VGRLRIQAFGGLQVFGPSGEVLPLPAKKPRALLAYLALHPGRPQARAKLAALLWGDSSETQARASLRQALLVLRRALDLADDELAATPGETITLAPGCVDVDVLAFERDLADSGPEALARAAASYAGELLEAQDTHEPAFDDWLMARRQQLREGAVLVLSRLLELHADSGRTEHAVAAALQLLALDPLQEAVHRRLMQLYALQGRHALALRQFQLCRDLLARELGARPQPATLQLREQIERQRQAPTASAPPREAGPLQEHAELRLVTVLAASSPLGADETDPERGSIAAERFMAGARDTVESFGGLFEPRLDTGVLAWFGVQGAHGDDAERAARCASRLHEQAVDVRMGLATGLVLVRRPPAESGQPLRISGETASLAARLAAAAAPGEVLVADGTWQALSRLAEGSPCAEAALPASLRGQRCWRLAALGPAPARRTGLVGRRTELAQFGASLQACRDSGNGLTLHLRGDPGIGKTRLVEAFVELAQQHGFDCHTGLVLDFGAGAERDPLRSLLMGLLGLRAAEPGALPAAGADAVASGRIDAACMPHLLNLLHCPLPRPLRADFDAMDDVTRQRGEREVLDSLLHRASRARPRVLVIEDLHWAQPHTLGQVAVLARAAEQCAAVLVTTARSDGDPLSAAWRAAAGVSALVTLDLGPLRWADAHTLAAQLGGAGDGFTLRCVERAAGNPLFLEQLMQGSRDRDTALPHSVQSVVQARLDGLTDGSRRCVRVASVLGQRFPLAALHHLLNPAAGPGPTFDHGLLRCEGDEGVFAHALVHECAYASLPRSHRRELHAVAARWYAGRDAVLHAEHLDRAEGAEAPQAYLDAAQSEAAAHRPERALQLVERGLALVGDGAPRFALACARADFLHDTGAMAQAQEAYNAALATATDDIERCRARIGLAAVLRVRDDLGCAAEALGQAEATARAHGLTAQRARIHWMRGNLLFPLGDLEGCEREHGRSLALAREAGAVELEAAALGGLGDAAFLQGRMLTAHGRFDACVALARRQSLRRVEAANLPMAAIARWYGGQTRPALEDARAAIDLAVQIGHRRAEAIAHHGAYQFCHALMDFDSALRHAEAAIDLARQIAAPRFEAEGLAFRGELRRTIGQRAQARDDLRQALAIARATGIAFLGPVFLGMLARAEDDPIARDQALSEGEALLADNGLAHNHLMFRRDAIDACLDAGDCAGALHHAAALERRTRPEPLPWADFLIARGRALAAHAAGARTSTAATALGPLLALSRSLGMLVDAVALDAALSNV
jgi:DNA-binding SARP family transcriptional activator